jgi:hypothetical protein
MKTEAANLSDEQKRRLAKVEMGTRFSFGRFGFRPAFSRRGARLRGLRYRLYVLARYAHRLRLLVLPNQGCGAHRIYDRPDWCRKSSRYAVYVGDMQASVYALDATTGALLWTRRVEDHFSARITAAPTL